MMEQKGSNDIFLTSTGVGHHHRPGYYFPSSEFQSILNEPVPPNLAKQDEVPRPQYFQTTTGNAHDNKFPHDSTYKQPKYKKAPGSWKVNYVKDHAEKLGKGGWRKPLTMGNQTSETIEEFSNKPGLREKYDFDPRPQPFNLKSHHTNGPSKQMVPSTENEALKGRPFFVRDKGVLPLNDIYLSTTQKDHRSFSRHELDGYPRKDAATYWRCEDYTQAWGHGTKDNPVPKDSVPRDRLPMRDPTWFKTATRVPRIPNSMVPVPHSGLKPLQKDSYTIPNDVKMKEIYYCPIDTPYGQPTAGPKSIMTVPKMYKTEYQHIGGKKVITV